MMPFRRLVFVCVVLFAFAARPQSTEYPPDLLPDFFGIPLDGGRVHSIAVHPSDNRRIITANQFGGLWKTTDGGARWQHVRSLPAVMVSDVAWAADGRTIIATLQRDNRISNGGGIRVSHDEGVTWTQPPTSIACGNDRTPARASAYGISFAPDEPATVYVGTNYGIAVSRDGGDHWTHQMLELTSPVHGDRLQNAVLSVLALPERKVLALTRTGIWRSDDRGATWRNTRPGNFTFYGAFKLMDTLPDDADKVLILVNYDSVLLYEVGTGTYSTITGPGGGSRGPFIRTSRAADGRADVWLGGGVLLRRATIGSVADLRALTAMSWMPLHRAEGIHDDSGYLAVDGDRRPVLYGSDGGVFKPANADATRWTRAGSGAAGLNSMQMTDLHATNVMRADGSIASVSLYFATQDNGLWNSSDAGATWPRADCAEGFFLEGPTRVSEGASLTLAYGKVGCGPSGSMFSGADFAGARAVPDVDTSGNAVTNMSQAFYLDSNQWIRYRSPAHAPTEIWVSDDDGQRWRRRATVALQVRGVFQSAMSPRGRIVLAPFRGLDAPDRTERVGFIRLEDPFAAPQSFAESDLLYLPDGGSLGLRATEFDWHAVFGVDPRDARFIIAPDIRNGVVKVTRNGGARWTTDAELTRLVTDDGALMMYDDQYHMQVTDIAFDPFTPGRIFVATRDAGVIVSNDSGANWQRVEGSEHILYGTGFGFEADRTVYVSSYGRGLWKIESPDDGGRRIGRIRDINICAIFDCRFFPRPDPRIRKVSWTDDPVILVQRGRVLGADLDAKGRLTRLSVTPGATVLRYGPEEAMPEFTVAPGAKPLSKKFNGGGKNGVTALLLHDGRLAHAVTTSRELTEVDVEKYVVVEHDDNEPKKERDDEGEAPQPYLIITTSVSIPGQPLLGSDRLLFVQGYDFPRNAKLTVRIDDMRVEAFLKVDDKGRISGEVRVPEELGDGLHTVEIIDESEQRPVVVAKSTFLIAATDDFEWKK
jgi:hypothetical protein